MLFHVKMTVRLPADMDPAQAARLKADGLPLDTLSMGMSDDLDAAIAAGSTMVRVGRAVFGSRAAPPERPDRSSI